MVSCSLPLVHDWASGLLQGGVGFRASENVRVEGSLEPRLPVNDEQTAKALASLPKILRGLDYEEGPIRTLLGVADPGQLQGEKIPNYDYCCRSQDSPLARLVSLFLLHQPVEGQRLRSDLGRELVEALERCRVLTALADGSIQAELDLYPCQGFYVFTDWVLTPQHRPGHVYELGADSYALARVTPRAACQRVLDLCTGSGIHALMGASHSQLSVGVDINPRALNYCRLNALVNGVADRCQWYEGSLFEPIPEGPYDLITVNPPFVPSPDRSIGVHRSPGESGEEVSSRLVAQLPRYLAPGGLFSMVLDYPIMRESTYLERLRSWLAEESGFGIAVMSFGAVSTETYILRHLSYNDGFEQFQKQFQDYLASYQRLGIEAVGFANVFVVRCSQATPTWTYQLETPLPKGPLQDRVREWLAGLEVFADPNWVPNWEGWRPRLSRHFVRLWRDTKKTQGLLEPVDLGWLQPTPLNRRQALLASRLNGRKTLAELAQQWSRTVRKPQAQASEDLLENLRCLGKGGAVDTSSESGF